MRHLEQDAGAVARVDLAAARSRDAQVNEDLQGLLDDAMGFAIVQIDDEARRRNYRARRRDRKGLAVRAGEACCASPVGRRIRRPG